MIGDSCMTEFWEFMTERCPGCRCLLNNSPECEGQCAHPDGCPAGPEYGPPPAG